MRASLLAFTVIMVTSGCESSLRDIYGSLSIENLDYCESSEDARCSSRPPTSEKLWVCDSLLHRCLLTDSCPIGISTCVNPNLPICKEGQCAPCAPAAAEGDVECAARAELRRDSLRLCVAGSCRECRASSDCPASKSVCEDGRCRPCAAHAECGSGICWLDDSLTTDASAPIGACAVPDEIAEVDAVCKSAGNGSAAEPYCTTAEALKSRRPFVRLRGGASPYPSLEIQGQSVRVIGDRASTTPHLGSVSVQKGSLILEQVNVDPPSLGDAITCGAAASVTLRHVKVRAALSQIGRGVLAEPDCSNLIVEQSWIEGVGGHGIAMIGRGDATSTRYRIVNTALRACGSTNPQLGSYAALLGPGTEGLFAFNTLFQNLDAITCQGRQPVENNIVVGGELLGCQLDRSDGPAADLDPASLKLLDTPRNRACCIDRADPDGTTSVDFYDTPRGVLPDRGFYELK